MDESNIQDKERYARRENHCEIERRRRNEMTAYITELSHMVPTCSALARKPDELTILRMAVTRMKALHGTGNTSSEGPYKPSFHNYNKGFASELMNREDGPPPPHPPPRRRRRGRRGRGRGRRNSQSSERRRGRGRGLRGRGRRSSQSSERRRDGRARGRRSSQSPERRRGFSPLVEDNVKFRFDVHIQKVNVADRKANVWQHWRTRGAKVALGVRKIPVEVMQLFSPAALAMLKIAKNKGIISSDKEIRTYEVFAAMMKLSTIFHSGKISRVNWQAQQAVLEEVVEFLTSAALQTDTLANDTVETIHAFAKLMGELLEAYPDITIQSYRHSGKLF
uniref:Aryl hydrocarbon receptor nuclear translocator homolog n=1 Tax=Glossina pallidipes TaxID=7398 RepID=A0A1B0AFR0_GLOPL